MYSVAASGLTKRYPAPGGPPRVVVNDVSFTLPAGQTLGLAWAIYEFINGPLRHDPWRLSKPLHDELEGFRGARRGEYRVIVRIDEGDRVVRVLRVDHRGHAYHS
jgi:mRNA-degrading endonuclease RelE of RelBE toxin-antitoxin system